MFNYKKFALDELEYIPVASVEEIPEGDRLFIDIDDLSLVLFNIAGDLYAIDDECTHDHETLGDGDLAGFNVTCPRHGAQFDVRNGKALSLPAVVDVAAYPTRIIEGQIEVGLPVDL